MQHIPPPFTRADLFGSTVSHLINPTPSINDEDNFQRRYDMADLRSQSMELMKSQLQGSIGLSTITATASYTTPNFPAVTTALAYPSRSDAPNITRWSRSEK